MIKGKSYELRNGDKITLLVDLFPLLFHSPITKKRKTKQEKEESKTQTKTEPKQQVKEVKEERETMSKKNSSGIEKYLKKETKVATQPNLHESSNNKNKKKIFEISESSEELSEQLFEKIKSGALEKNSSNTFSSRSILNYNSDLPEKKSSPPLIEKNSSNTSLKNIAEDKNPKEENQNFPAKKKQVAAKKKTSKNPPKKKKAKRDDDEDIGDSDDVAGLEKRSIDDDSEGSLEDFIDKRKEDKDGEYVPPRHESEEEMIDSPNSKSCQYGRNCYRNNPNHYLEFSHPFGFYFLPFFKFFFLHFF